MSKAKGDDADRGVDRHDAIRLPVVEVVVVARVGGEDRWDRGGGALSPGWMRRAPAEAREPDENP